MSTDTDRRSRKRLATRQHISNIATRMFMERGFDNVTVDEIAEAADVGRVTVFNHFPRKEDLFFDRDIEGRQRVRDALRECEEGTSPVEWLRLLAHRLIAEGAPFLEFSERSQVFFDTVEASNALKARARAISDELAFLIVDALVECTGRSEADSDTRLAAALQVGVWGFAYLEAHRTFRASRDTKAAEAMFLRLIDRGSDGLKAALAGTELA